MNLEWAHPNKWWQPRVVVGLTMGAAAVHAVRLVRAAEGLTLEAYVSAEWPVDRAPHPAEITTAINTAIGPLRREKSRIIAAVGPREADLHLWDLPFDSTDKVRRVLKYEAEPMFLTPVDDLILDFMPLTKTYGADKSRSGVVFGTKPGTVSAVVQNLNSAGVEPAAIVPDRLGLIAAGVRLFSGRPEPRFRLLVDLGASQTGMVLFDGLKPRLSRSVFCGGRDLTQTLAEALSLEWVEAEERKRQTDLSVEPPSAAAQALHRGWQKLITEIRRTVASVSAELTEGHLVIVLGGGGAGTPGLLSFLASSLGLEVVLVSDYAADDSLLPEFRSEALSALGLALLAYQPGHRPNLRQGQLTSSRTWARHRGPLTFMAIGLTLVICLNLGELFFSYSVEAQKYGQVKAEMESLYRRTVPGTGKVVAPLSQLKQELEKARSSALGLDIEGARVLDLLNELSRLVSAQAGLRITDLALNPQTLELAGEGPSFEIIDRFKTQLGGLPFFSQVSLGGVKQDPNTKTLTFRMTMKRKIG